LWHRLEDHLSGTALLASRFAEPFGGGRVAWQLGLLHDAGKASCEWQARLREVADTDRPVGWDHKLLGARLARERGLTTIHSTNNRHVIAGAATLTLETLEDRPDLDAMVVAVGGGSQSVGAMTVTRAIRPAMRVFGVQAERASAAHDSWHAGRAIATSSADTFADGLATRNVYALTFAALREGLSGFVTASEAELAEALLLLLSATHNLAEGAGAAGLAGLFKLRETLRGKKVAIVISGSNIDRETLRRIVNGQI